MQGHHVTTSAVSIGVYCRDAFKILNVVVTSGPLSHALTNTQRCIYSNDIDIPTQHESPFIEFDDLIHFAQIHTVQFKLDIKY